MDSLGLCCNRVIFGVCATRFFAALLFLGACLFTSFVIMRFSSEPTPTNGPLSEESWKRKTMEDFEVNKRRHVYLFNWTNTNGFITKNEIPEMSEVGPFVFSEEVKLLNFSWGNDKVSYDRKSIWSFVPDKSLSLDLEITTLNPILAITVNKVKDTLNPLIQREFDYIIEKKDNFSVTKSIRELLFDGFVDKSFIPLKITPVEKFGWFYKNNSIDGKFTLFSDGRLIYNNSAVLFDASSDKLYFSILDMTCSNFSFNTSRLTYYSGYDVGLNCFNQTRESSPVSISLPHFLDRQIIGIKGLSPSPELHRPNIIFDYPSRVRLETNKTYQLNMKISHISWSSTYLKNLTTVDVPMIWYKDISRMPDTIWDNIASERNRDKNDEIYTTLAAISFTFIVICFGFFVLKKFITRNNSELLLIDNEH